MESSLSWDFSKRKPGIFFRISAMRVRYYHYAENISLIVWGLYLFSESSRHFPNYSLWNWKSWRKYPRKKWMRHFLGNNGASQISSAPRDLFIHLLPSWHHRCHWVKNMSLHNEWTTEALYEGSKCYFIKLLLLKFICSSQRNNANDNPYA